MTGLSIVGLGMVTGPQLGRSARSVQSEACWKAIEDAGLQREDIDGAIDARFSGGAGEYPSWSDPFPRNMGLPINFFFSIGRGGALGGLAIMAAHSFLMQGQAKYVLVSGVFNQYSKSKAARETGQRGTIKSTREGHWGRAVGDVAAVTHHAWFASRHMYEYGTTPEQLGSIAVQTRAWANLNPDARMYEKKMTIEDYSASPWVAEPYRLFDVCQLSDGAISLVITTDEHAADCKQKPIRILGQGVAEATAKLWWDQENYTRMPVQRAKEKAFADAGIASIQDIDVAQFYDCFTGEVLFQIEDYGYAPKGEGGAWAAEGHMGPGGDSPINTGGGLLSCAHNADLVGLAESVIQLRGDAGERQVEGARTALSTGHGGELTAPGLCSIHTTTILGVD